MKTAALKFIDHAWLYDAACPQRLAALNEELRILHRLQQLHGGQGTHGLVNLLGYFPE